MFALLVLILRKLDRRVFSPVHFPDALAVETTTASPLLLLYLLPSFAAGTGSNQLRKIEVIVLSVVNSFINFNLFMVPPSSGYLLLF